MTARLLEAFDKPGFRVDARSVVRNHCIDFADPGFVGPSAERVFKLRNGERGANDIWRLGGDDRCSGVHHNHQLLCFRRNVACTQGFRREHEAGENIDLIAHHQFLRQSLGYVGIWAAGIPADDFNLLAGNSVTMLLDIKLYGIVHLCGGVGELTGVGHDQSDLDGLLGLRRGYRQNCRRDDQQSLSHSSPPDSCFSQSV